MYVSCLHNNAGHSYRILEHVENIYHHDPDPDIEYIPQYNYFESNAYKYLRDLIIYKLEKRLEIFINISCLIETLRDKDYYVIHSLEYLIMKDFGHVLIQEYSSGHYTKNEHSPYILPPSEWSTIPTFQKRLSYKQIELAKYDENTEGGVEISTSYSNGTMMVGLQVDNIPGNYDDACNYITSWIALNSNSDDEL